MKKLGDRVNEGYLERSGTNTDERGPWRCGGAMRFRNRRAGHVGHWLSGLGLWLGRLGIARYASVCTERKA